MVGFFLEKHPPFRYLTSFIITSFAYFDYYLVVVYISAHTTENQSPAFSLAAVSKRIKL